MKNRTNKEIIINALVNRVNGDLEKGNAELLGYLFEKSKKGEIGEIRVWSGKKFQKQGNGKWKPVQETEVVERSKEEVRKNPWPESVDKLTSRSDISDIEREVRKFYSNLSQEKEDGRHTSSQDRAVANYMGYSNRVKQKSKTQLIADLKGLYDSRDRENKKDIEKESFKKEGGVERSKLFFRDIDSLRDQSIKESKELGESFMKELKDFSIERVSISRESMSIEIKDSYPVDVSYTENPRTGEKEFRLQTSSVGSLNVNDPRDPGYQFIRLQSEILFDKGLQNKIKSYIDKMGEYDKGYQEKIHSLYEKYDIPRNERGAPKFSLGDFE